jgi:hypothetical protein
VNSRSPACASIGYVFTIATPHKTAWQAGLGIGIKGRPRLTADKGAGARQEAKNDDR